MPAIRRDDIVPTPPEAAEPSVARPQPGAAPAESGPPAS